MRPAQQGVFGDPRTILVGPNGIDMDWRSIVASTAHGEIGIEQPKLVEDAALQQRQRLQWLDRRTAVNFVRNLAETEQQRVIMPNRERAAMDGFDTTAARHHRQDRGAGFRESRHHGRCRL